MGGISNLTEHLPKRKPRELSKLNTCTQYVTEQPELLKLNPYRAYKWTAGTLGTLIETIREPQGVRFQTEHLHTIYKWTAGIIQTEPL